VRAERVRYLFCSAIIFLGGVADGRDDFCICKLTKKIVGTRVKNGFCERLQGESLCGVNNFPCTLHRVSKKFFYGSADNFLQLQLHNAEVVANHFRGIFVFTLVGFRAQFAENIYNLCISLTYSSIIYKFTP